MASASKVNNSRWIGQCSTTRQLPTVFSSRRRTSWPRPGDLLMGKMVSVHFLRTYRLGDRSRVGSGTGRSCQFSISLFSKSLTGQQRTKKADQDAHEGRKKCPDKQGSRDELR